MSRVADGLRRRRLGAWTRRPRSTTGFVPQGIGADLIATLEGWSPHGRRHVRRAVATTAPPRRGPTATSTASVVPVRDRNGADRAGPGRVHPARHHRREPRRAQAVVRRASARGAASTRWRWRSTTGSSGSTTSTTPATPRASSTAPRWWRSAASRSATDLGLTPRARIVATAVSGADPTIMLTGPAPAARKALAKAGLDGRRHRPVRDQRGVRRGRDAVHARPGHHRTRTPTSTAARSRWATRSAPPAR